MIDYVRFRLCATILNSNLRICSNSSNGSSNRWDINSIPLVRLNSTLHFYTTISIALQSRDSKIRLSTMKTTYRISFSKVTIVQTTFVEIDARGIKSCFPFKGKTLTFRAAILKIIELCCFPTYIMALRNWWCTFIEPRLRRASEGTLSI